MPADSGQSSRPPPPTPLPVDPRSAELVLFGGSFDPPHRAHFAFARFVLETVPGSSLIFVPAARSPHKSTGPIATGPQRVAMLEAGLSDLGLATDPRIGIWTDELDRAESGSEPSYFVDTLCRARSLLPASVRVRFVIGSDQWCSLGDWREPHAILELAAPILLVRGASVETTPPAPPGPSAPPGSWSAAERLLFDRAVLPHQPRFDASSTQARALLANDPQCDDLDALLTPSVLHLARGIYRG
ncbi:MAG: nicotinate-nicotinamide nucleotide adenylyltransferase [Phycisphaeraceae bacterium]|nr:nicotinate-nicotinamide nucleotide adenylyltransferase [Phycisphaeraceae bacterium]MCW5762775.1 nicotinate-nicotinamide nucleotide adenylyltransferase [Phycisphaeraceae bacterium]